MRVKDLAINTAFRLTEDVQQGVDIQFKKTKNENWIYQARAVDQDGETWGVPGWAEVYTASGGVRCGVGDGAMAGGGLGAVTLLTIRIVDK